MVRHVALFRWKPETSEEGGLRTYADHPHHQAVTARLIRPITEQREAIRYVIDHND